MDNDKVGGNNLYKLCYIHPNPCPWKLDKFFRKQGDINFLVIRNEDLLNKTWD